jgi:hypothetical protein
MQAVAIEAGALKAHPKQLATTGFELMDRSTAGTGQNRLRGRAARRATNGQSVA